MRRIMIGVCCACLLPTQAKGEINQCKYYAATGIKLEQFELRETGDQGALLDRESGLLPGLQVDAGLNCRNWNAVLATDVQRAYVDYDGKTNTGRKLTSRTLEHVNQISLKIERRFTLSDMYDLGIYAGAGHRNWKRIIAGVGSVGGLDERYSWRQYFLGANLTLAKSGAHLLSMDARMLRLSDAVLDVDFRGVFDKPADLELPARNGWRVAIPWRYTLDSANTISAEPYAQGWRIARSDAMPLSRNGVVVGAFFEPASQTRLYGINATWSHWF